MSKHEQGVEIRHDTRSAIPLNPALILALREYWRQDRRTPNSVNTQQAHLPDEVLYDLALGELTPEARPEIQTHLADCQDCTARLHEFQTAIAADRKVRALWQPPVRYAAGETQAAPVIQALTTEGKYQITLRPATDGRDLLTLAVMPSFRQTLEGAKVMVISHQGTLILQGTIAGGDLSRLIPRRFRDEWPFRIQAG